MTLLRAGEFAASVGTITWPAAIVSVYDGDSCKVNADRGLGDWKIGQAIRIAGINAPELRILVDHHWVLSALGEAARIALQTILYADMLPLPVQVVVLGWDNYGGRIDARLILPDGSSAGQRMIERGYAVPLGPYQP